MTNQVSHQFLGNKPLILEAIKSKSEKLYEAKMVSFAVHFALSLEAHEGWCQRRQSDHVVVCVLSNGSWSYHEASQNLVIVLGFF